MNSIELCSPLYLPQYLSLQKIAGIASLFWNDVPIHQFYGGPLVLRRTP